MKHGAMKVAKDFNCLCSYQILKFINCESGFFYDIVERAFFDFLMERNNNRDIFLQVVHKNVASSLMVNDKSLPSERLDNVFA